MRNDVIAPSFDHANLLIASNVRILVILNQGVSAVVLGWASSKLMGEGAAKPIFFTAATKDRPKTRDRSMNKRNLTTHSPRNVWD